VKGLKAGEVWNGSLELFGYDVAPVESDVVAGETKLVPSIVLKPTAQKVVITSDPSGADVMLNGEVVGKTPLEIANMPPKSEVAYTLCLDGYDDTQVRRRRTGKTLELKTSLKPKPIVEVAPPSQSSEGNRAGGERDFEIAPGVNITMCWIPAGEFMMGSPAGESGRSEDETQHRVKISKGFWLAKTETTQAQWQAVMGSNPSNFKGADLPVESVSWDDIAGMGGFLARINDSAVDGWHFHLPSEAQWEYACRAGSTRNGDSELGAKAWYAENSGEKTHSVGQKQSNAWGLYDMLGNVCEWCDDWYGACPVSTTTDPSGPTSGSHKVLRGGCWRSDARKCRARHSSLPSSAIIIFGFRVARSSIINEADKGAGASANQIEPAQGPAVEAAASWKTYTNQRFGFRFDYPEVLRSKSNPTNGAGLCFTDGNLTVTAEGHFLTDSFDAWWNSMLKDLGDKVTYKVKKSTWAVISGVGEDGVEFYIKRCVLGGNWAGFSASYPHSMNRKYDPVITQMSEKFVPFLPGDYDRAPYPTIR
jgi:formylglycine-generating enzyme required for sulfatase activity